MSLDMLAIADGIATRYLGVSPPSNPAVYDGEFPEIRSATARIPNALTKFPCVEVYPPGPGDSSFIYAGGQRRGEHLFTVRFYYGRSSGDLARDFVALYSWFGVLVDCLHGASKLGLAPEVTKALLEEGGIGTHEFAGIEYGVIELSVRVWTEDSVTLVAA